MKRLSDRTLVVLAISALLLSACDRAPSGPPPTGEGARSSMTTLDVMNTMTKVASDAVFKAAAEPPANDEQWAAIRNQAQVLADGGQLLMSGDAVKDPGDWIKLSRAHVQATDVVMKAATEKNAEALARASDDLYETCAGCHEQYLPLK